MTVPQVWVSETSRAIEFDGRSPGEHWQLVGEIDTSVESDFFTYVQVFITPRKTAKGRPEFYLDGDPDSDWVKSAERKPFWVAIDPWGEARTSFVNTPPTFLVSKAKATVTSLARHQPEARRRGTVRPVKIPIKLKRTDGEVFELWEHAG